MDALTDGQIDEGLAELPDWVYDGEAITKAYSWASFRDAIEFVNDIADLAEDMNHHPDLEIYFDEVVVSLRTHSEDAVTERDFAMARDIEDLVEAHAFDVDDVDDLDDLG